MQVIRICADDTSEKGVPIQDLVDRAIRLKREIEERERELRQIKAILRHQAESQPRLPEGDKTVVFEGNLGEVQVVFSDPVMEIDQSKARDIINLFGDLFDNYFRIIIDFRDREALSKFFEEHPNIREQFESMTIKRESRPRVTILRI